MTNFDVFQLFAFVVVTLLIFIAINVALIATHLRNR